LGSWLDVRMDCNEGGLGFMKNLSQFLVASGASANDEASGLRVFHQLDEWTVRRCNDLVLRDISR